MLPVAIPMRVPVRWLPALLLALVAIARAAPAPISPDKDHRVKAVFLFNFAQFVEWPETAFHGPKDSLVVGILGDDPFEDFLDEVVKGESVRDRPIVVKRFKRLEDIKECHVLFISAGEAGRLDGSVGALKDRKILTVGESQDFLAQGGMIRFVEENGKVRFQINLEAVQDADLSISSKLLRVAQFTLQDRE
jgi:hypothetical protein